MTRANIAERQDREYDEWQEQLNRKVGNVSFKDLERIIELSKLRINKLRKLNPDRAYSGRELTKSQLIFQIIFKIDAP